MGQDNNMYIALHAPNIVNVCIDSYQGGEMRGRIYHCYDTEPWYFSNIIKMIEQMECLYDRILFPQASTRIRSFRKEKRKEEPLIKVAESREIEKYRGELGTFLIHVKYRQNSSWQGELSWIEGTCNQEFLSVLELLKIINNDLQS